MAVNRLPLAMVVSALFVLPMMAPLASADGMMHYYSDVYDDWNLSAEETQYGMINFVNGQERFMLAIRIDDDSLRLASRAVWMFALPADASTVHVSLMPSVTELEGEDLGETASKELCSNLLLGYGTQLYPIIMLPLIGSTDHNSLLYGSRTPEDVEVSQHVESYGLTVEVVSTENADALDAYLEDCGLYLDSLSYSLITEYVGDEYSFVVSWISDVDQFLIEATPQYDHISESSYYELGLLSTFPTDRIFYPMRLTSVYGSAVVPMLLQVIGCVEPDDDAFDYDGLDIALEYKVEDNYYVSAQLSPFFTSDQLSDAPDGYAYVVRDLRYTEVVITVPSDQLKADLWMVSTSASAANLQSWVLDNGLATAIMIVLALSATSGIIAGALVFAPYRPILWKFGALGLANVLTIIGLWLVARKVEFERTFTKSEIPVLNSPYRSDFLVVYTFAFFVSMSFVLLLLW